MKAKAVAYWLVRGEYDMSGSDAWENVVFRENERTHSAVEAVADEIVERLRKDRPPAYAVVTDCVSEPDVRVVTSRFISNNIVRITGRYDKAKITNQICWVVSNFGLNMNTDENEIFFTSDQHFFHGNICRYCNRPWNSGKDENGDLIIMDDDVARMNEDLVANWNSVVSKNSKVFCLGDFCLGKNQKENIPKLVSRLNGKITLVMGNHDSHSVGFYYDAGFSEVYRFPILWNNFFILSHIPVQWITKDVPYANLFGHTHNQEMYKHVTSNTFNCCVEVNDYKPVSFSEIKRQMKRCAQQ